IANGWVIIAESSNDLIRQRGELDDRVSISSDSGLATIAFTATGQAESAGTVTIRTDGCAGDEDTLITLLTSGQVAVRKLTCFQ
ncbi:MAG: GspH/FimT family pseudopilin, partial [Thalassolituus sp.]